MQEGFILEAIHAVNVPSRWVAGAPERSFLFGTKADGKEQHPIRSFRCASCEFLESFARD